MSASHRLVSVLSLSVLVVTLLTPIDDAWPRSTRSATPKIAAHEKGLHKIPGAQLLQEWTFDDPGGLPDPQGWTTYDATATTDTFFHVDDFAGLGGGSFGRLTPLEGQRSLWCGLRADDPRAAGWLAAPGYGNSWRQNFESVDFPVSNPMEVGYLIRFDSEDPFDFTRFQFLSAAGRWETLATYTGQGEALEQFVLPADSLGATVRLRFRFTSDTVYSDEGPGSEDFDGAVLVDSITVRGNGLLLDSQDFESTDVGAVRTADGDWEAHPGPAFGDFAALFDGTTLLQEDPVVTNTTNVWGFFDGSTDTYECGGHPEQAAVPRARFVNGNWLTLDNEVRSPWFSLTEDVNGDPVASSHSIVLEFDVYEDLPLANFVFYTFAVRAKVDGVTGPWRDDGFARYGPSGTRWNHFLGDLTSLVDPGATEAQVALVALDGVLLFGGGLQPDGRCHSHSPLFDNVSVSAIGPDSTVVTNTDDSGPGSLRQAILDANLVTNFTSIRFEIPGAGPHEILLLDPLPAIASPVVLDATTQPGYVDAPVVELRCGWSFETAGNGLRVGFGNSTVRGLSFRSFDATRSPSVIRLASDGNVVEGNVIRASSLGVQVAGSGNRIGGIGPGEANVLENLSGDAINVFSGSGNVIRGNAISGNAGLGIDLGPSGIQANDALDADTGANGLQNHPVITATISAVNRIIGTLQSTPNTSFELDFYANPQGCDPSGHGEGARYLGSVTVTTDPTGQASFTATVGQPFLDYESLTATATHPTDGTSEFSACYTKIRAEVVINTNDSGFGSLRQAITTTNANAGTEAILFDIPGPGPHLIQPITPLPAITGSIVLDGYSQPGASVNSAPAWTAGNADIRVAIDGSLLAGPSDSGLWVQAGYSIIRGLAIGNCPGPGINVDAEGVKVEGCYIGLDAAGTVARPNGVGIEVAVVGLLCTIGGPDPADRNVISANLAEGVQLLTTSDNWVRGNFIGTDVSGSVDLGNGSHGIRLGKAVDDNIWFNLISGNGGIGLLIGGPTVTAQTDVRGNRIGTDASGSGALGNDGIGVRLDGGLGGGNLVQIGGAPERANLIAFNGEAGVAVNLPPTATAQVGYNIIHSNAAGIVVTDTKPLSPQTKVDLRANEIFSNAGLGIDLGDDGVTPNDPAPDADDGPNGLQNFPVLTSASSVGDTLVVTGTLESGASSQYRLDFFSSSACDPSGYGEGRDFLDSEFLSTNALGQLSFEVRRAINVPGGAAITATARSSTEGGTSEFSACVTLFNSVEGTSVPVVPVDESTGATPVTLVFDEITAAGNTTLTAGSSGPPVPGDFLVADSSIYWNLTTTATFADSIEICFEYDEADLAGEEVDIALLHYDDTLVPPDWVDIRRSLDTVNDVVCGRTASLSPFLVAVRDRVTSTPTTRRPQSFALHPNVPNPFNPATTLAFDVPRAGVHVTLRIYDALGRRVRTLVDGPQTAGTQRVIWDGRSADGRRVASGIYFYRMEAAGFVQTRKMALLK